MSLSVTRSSLVRWLIALATAALLAACGNDRAVSQPPLVIRSGDVCAVCGMYITHQPGPRGEAYVEALKFDSTRDFFAYVTQPDVVSRLESAYVQDTARIDWAPPSNAAESFIDARKAYYVAWQPLSGGMGPTFASFARRADADAFIRAHGGAVLRFDQITRPRTCPGASSRRRVERAPEIGVRRRESQQQSYVHWLSCSRRSCGKMVWR
jgi:copper chaperone NosL